MILPTNMTYDVSREDSGLRQCVKGYNQNMKSTTKTKQNSYNEDSYSGHSPGAQGGEPETTSMQKRVSQRLLSKDSLRVEPQTPVTSNPTVLQSTGAIKKVRLSKTPSETESDDDTQSIYSNRSKTSKIKTLPQREAKSKSKITQVEFSNLKDVEKLCDRLNAPNKNAIICYIESIINSNIQLAEQLSKFQAGLTKPEEANIRLSKRLNALENKPSLKQAAKAAAKQNKANTIKDLVKLIPTLKPNSP